MMMTSQCLGDLIVKRIKLLNDWKKNHITHAYSGEVMMMMIDDDSDDDKAT